MATWKPTYADQSGRWPEPQRYPHATSWLPIVLMLVAIAAESTRIAGTATTEHLLLACTHRLHVATPSSQIITTNWELRKVGHFFGYGMLGVVIARCWTHRTSFHAQRASHLGAFQAAGLGTLCAATIASLDEWHQSFLPGRCSSIHDVALDTLGAVTCILIYLLCTVKRAHPASDLSS